MANPAIGEALERPNISRAAAEGREVWSIVRDRLGAVLEKLLGGYGSAERSFNEEEIDLPSDEAYGRLDELRAVQGEIAKGILLPDAEVEIGPIERADLSDDEETAEWVEAVRVTVRHPWLAEPLQRWSVIDR